MVRIGRLDFEADNYGDEYDRVFAEIRRRWGEGGGTPLPELNARMLAQGIAQKKIDAAVKYLKDNGLIEAKSIGGLEVEVPKDRVAVVSASPWLTLDEAAKHIGVSRRTIYAWVKSGRLTAYRTEAGGTLRFRTEDLDRCLRPIGSEATAMSGPLTHHSDPVLAELWDNEYDAVYDDL